MDITTWLLLTLLLLFGINLWVLISIKKNSSNPQTEASIIKLSESISKIDPLIRDEFTRNRDENQRNSRENREELSKSFINLSDTLQNAFKNTREDLGKSLKSSEESSTQNIKELRSEIQQKLESIRGIVEDKLQKLQDENSKKLEEMRATVDEKLQTTLEKRFNDSFKLISDRLEQVHKGLGEMQNLATGVGDLKKVLTNVKTRGNMGEIQLGNILEQIFSNEQFERNSVVKPGSLERVEFAIKLPGKNIDNTALLLPIDSKFPNEDYQRLIETYENAATLTPKELEDAIKQFEYSVKKSAKEIRDKYINPPITTDFAIMFVPTEGLYAEILRRTGLFELLQREYHITVVGPTNLVAFLSSLQMGFRTLAIEKRSSEVWQILGAVKTQFGTFGTILEKTKKKLQEATNVIEDAGTKSRVIERKLRNVQELPHSESIALLGKAVEIDLEESNSSNENELNEDPELPF